jgi:hypothetical protein
VIYLSGIADIGVLLEVLSQRWWPRNGSRGGHEMAEGPGLLDREMADGEKMGAQGWG